MNQTENSGINLGMVSHNTALVFLQKPLTYPSYWNTNHWPTWQKWSIRKPQQTGFFSACNSLGNYRLLLRAKERYFKHIYNIHIYIQGFSTQSHALLVKCEWPTEKERGRLKPAVVEEPSDLNINNILNTLPGRLETAWGNGQHIHSEAGSCKFCEAQ